MKTDVVKLVKRLIILSMAVMSFFALGNTIIAHPNPAYDFAFNGFEMLFLPDMFGGYSTWVVIMFFCFSWVELLMALVLIVLAIIPFIVKKNSSDKPFSLLVIIGSFAVALLYLSSAIGMFIGYAIADAGSDILEYYTLAYMPLFYQTVLMVAYIVVPKIITNATKKEESAEKVPVQKVESKVETVEEVDVVEQIKKFKELLDAGAITQEEFDKKKKELLG